jgi:hypothetical protein
VEELLENLLLFSFFGDRKLVQKLRSFCLLLAGAGPGVGGWFTVKK